MKRTESLALSEVIQQYFGEEPELHEHLLEMRVAELISEVLKPIQKYIGKSYVKDSVLYLQVFSSSVKQTLLIERNTLIRRMNDALGIELIREVRIY